MKFVKVTLKVMVEVAIFGGIEHIKVGLIMVYGKVLSTIRV